jgi:hypothetical protein
VQVWPTGPDKSISPSTQRLGALAQYKRPRPIQLPCATSAHPIGVRGRSNGQIEWSKVMVTRRGLALTGELAEQLSEFIVNRAVGVGTVICSMPVVKFAQDPRLDQPPEFPLRRALPAHRSTYFPVIQPLSRMREHQAQNDQPRTAERRG